jgi:hypothetical protein
MSRIFFLVASIALCSAANYSGICADPALYDEKMKLAAFNLTCDEKLASIEQVAGSLVDLDCSNLTQRTFVAEVGACCVAGRLKCGKDYRAACVDPTLYRYAHACETGLPIIEARLQIQVANFDCNSNDTLARKLFNPLLNNNCCGGGRPKCSPSECNDKEIEDWTSILLNSVACKNAAQEDQAALLACSNATEAGFNLLSIRCRAIIFDPTDHGRSTRQPTPASDQPTAPVAGDAATSNSHSIALAGLTTAAAIHSFIVLLF